MTVAVAFSLLQRVERLQDELLKMPQADIKTDHAFRPGEYLRTITIPPWTVLTGAAHKTAYRVKLERGQIAVNMSDGEVHLLTAPHEFDAPAGAQRAGRVLGDEVVWTDIYDNPDDCRDIPTLEARLYEIPPCGLGENRQRDRLDFERFRASLGWTQEQMDSVVKIEHDLMPMPAGFDVEVRDSALHGKGLFALRRFVANEVVCPGRLDGKRTPAGRYTNHSAAPNVTPIKRGDDIHAMAIRAIEKGEEILVDYRASMRVNFGIEMKEPSCLDG